MRAARETTRLLSDEVGVHLSRSLTSVIAQSSTLGPIMASAFSVFAVVGFISVITQATTKLTDWIAETFIFTDAQKAMNEVLVKSNKMIMDYNAQTAAAVKAGALIGLTGSTRTNVEMSQVQKEIDDTKARMLQLHNNMWQAVNEPQADLRRPDRPASKSGKTRWAS